MDGGICVAGWAIKGKYAKLTSNMYGVFEFVVHYLVHMIALVILYGKVRGVKESHKKSERYHIFCYTKGKFFLVVFNERL